MLFNPRPLEDIARHTIFHISKQISWDSQNANNPSNAAASAVVQSLTNCHNWQKTHRTALSSALTGSIRPTDFIVVAKF